MQPWTYRGRWAVVTGASAGIGTEFAHALAARGMNVVLAARREDRLRALGDELAGKHGVRAVVVPVDLGAPGGPAELWRAASSEGRAIDLLVNNAGFGLLGRFTELPRERQSEMVRLNCSALLELCHLALTEMQARRSGAILNVASIAAYQAIPDMAAYAATKAFVLSLSEALSEEARPHGVRVVALCPGPVATEFQQVAGTKFGPGTYGLRSVEEVVAAGLDGVEAGHGVVIPGVVNRLGVLGTRLVPRRLAARVAARVMRRTRH